MTSAACASLRRRTVSVLLACGASLGPLASAAHAADPSPPASADARAEQLFRSGEKKFDTGDYPGACNDFAESLKLGSKLGTLLNLALCHEIIGRTVTAWKEFSHGAAWAAHNNQRDRYEFAVQHVRALEAKLPRVVLDLPEDDQVGALDLDGEPLPEQDWYLPLFLDPGEHRIAVSAPGKQRTTVAFSVIASPNEQVVYIPRLLEAMKEPVVIPPRPPRKDIGLRRALGIAGLGFGAGGVLVGTTFGVFAMTGDARDPEVKTQATIATASFLTGVAFAATGGWLVWTSRPEACAPVSALAVTPRGDGAAALWTTTF
jgi:hypothetical protein